MADPDTTERWRPVVGYEGHYEVSDRGRVRSVDRVVPSGLGRTRRHRGRVLKPGTVRGQHQYVNLSRVHLDGKAPRSAYVHQLVLAAFVGPCPDAMEVCHNNGDHADNRLENLRYDTHAENMRDTVRHGRHWSQRASAIGA